MKSLVILFIGLGLLLLGEGMILAEIFGNNRFITGLFFATGGGFCIWCWIRQIKLVKNEKPSNHRQLKALQFVTSRFAKQLRGWCEVNARLMRVDYILQSVESFDFKRFFKRLRGEICKKLYEKDFYLVLTVVVGQDFGKRMIHRGAYNVTDVVQAR